MVPISNSDNSSIECCTLQDTFNQLFSGRSIDERGTLSHSQLKNDFGHRNVTSDVINCFNYADNFLWFVIEAHIIYLTLKLCGMAEIDSEPSDVDTLLIDDDRRRYLPDVSSRIVQHVWMLPSLSEITNVTEVHFNKSFRMSVQSYCTPGTYGVHGLHPYTIFVNGLSLEHDF